MASWNGLDFLIFLIFAANTILGMARGASREIISMMCLCVALIFMIKFTVPLANFFNSSPLIVDVVDNQFIRNFMVAAGAGPLTAQLLKEVFYSISILICFVSIFSICEAALTKAGVVTMLPFPYAVFDRKLGAALGCTRGYVISIIFLAILNLHIFKSSDIPWMSDSFFARLFQGSTVKLDSLITGQNPDKYREIFEDKELFNATEIFRVIGDDPTKMPTTGTTPDNKTDDSTKSDTTPVNNPPALPDVY